MGPVWLPQNEQKGEQLEDEVRVVAGPPRSHRALLAAVWTLAFTLNFIGNYWVVLNMT